jgi:hypothetical protein
VVNFILLLIHLLLMVTIASYTIGKFRASTSTAGLVAGIIIIGALIGRLGAGRIIEDIGSKKILTVGIIFGLHPPSWTKCVSAVGRSVPPLIFSWKHDFSRLFS